MNAVSEAFVEAVEACGRLDRTPITQRPGKVAEFDAGGWHVAINAGDAETSIEPSGGMRVDVPPKCVAVWWNGWFAGLLYSNGGTLAAGEAANEDTFIAAMKGVK